PQLPPLLHISLICSRSSPYPPPLRPPPATLFPYTTLFRSAILIVVVIEPDGSIRIGPQHQRDRGRQLFDGRRFDGRLHKIGVGLDRKSTRLNSSHVSISYAVFCLKKKRAAGSRQSLDDRCS